MQPLLFRIIGSSDLLRFNFNVNVRIYFILNLLPFYMFQLINGLVHYIYPRQTIVLDQYAANDGAWHYLEARWLPGKVVVTLDYGQVQKEVSGENWAVSKVVKQVYVGGKPESISNKNIIINGLKGCVKVNTILLFHFLVTDTLKKLNNTRNPYCCFSYFGIVI